MNFLAFIYSSFYFPITYSAVLRNVKFTSKSKRFKVFNTVKQYRPKVTCTSVHRVVSCWGGVCDCHQDQHRRRQVDQLQHRVHGRCCRVPQEIWGYNSETLLNLSPTRLFPMAPRTKFNIVSE